MLFQHVVHMLADESHDSAPGSLCSAPPSQMDCCQMKLFNNLLLAY